MSVRFFRAPLAALPMVLALAPTKSLAQATAPAGTLVPMVVSASRSEQLLVDVLPHTTLIGRDRIESSQAPDLPSLLVHEAGFQFTQNGGPGTASNLFLRGSASLQVLVLIDGVPMTKQDTTGTVSLEHIPLDHIERVEIVRGNVSAIYGSGAVGGVIQVFTRQAEGAPSVQATVEAGSRGSARASAMASGRSGATRFSLGMARRVTDGFSSMDAQQFPNENLDDDGYRNSSAHLSVDHEWAAQQSLGLRWQGVDGRYAFDGGGFGTATDQYLGRNQMGALSLVSRNRLGEGWTSALTLTAGRERITYDASLTASPYRSEATTHNRGLSWTHTLAAASRIYTAGVEHQWQSIESADSFGAQPERARRITSAFAGVTGEWSAHSYQMNVRHDRTQGGPSKSTAYLGYGFQLNSNWKLVASASTAFNQAPLGYLYDPFSGNASLRPESARSAEWGLQWAQESNILRVTAFATRIDDLLQYNFNTFGFDNVSAARNRGVELSFAGRWGTAQTRASFTLQDPIDLSTGERLIRRARIMASAGASVPMGAWQLNGDMRFSGRRTDLPGRPEMASYVLIDLSASRALNADLTWQLRVDNLTDRRYQTAYGYNQPRRAFYLGLRWQPR